MTAPTPGELDIEDRANALKNALQRIHIAALMPGVPTHKLLDQITGMARAALAKDALASGPTNTPVNRER